LHDSLGNRWSSGHERLSQFLHVLAPSLPGVEDSTTLDGIDAYGLRVEGALAEDEFALTPPMLRPLLFGDPDSELALQTVPDSQPPERVESALHARVAAARLAWQFPYDRKLRGRLARASLPALVVWANRIAWCRRRMPRPTSPVFPTHAGRYSLARGIFLIKSRPMRAGRQ
jgi:hypothetical protein